MKLSRLLVVFTMALAPVFVTSNAGAQTYPPPAWSSVMDMLNSPTIHSGTHWSIGNNQALSQFNTDLGALQTLQGWGESNNLILPVASLPASGHNWTCNGTSYPVNNALDFVESNLGFGLQGIAFQAAFNSPSPNLNIFESVFFNDDQCYGATVGSHSREYGIFLDLFVNQFYAYWGTNVNRSNVSQAQLQIGSGVLSPNTLYNWYMYPVTVGSGCYFQIYVTPWNSGTPVWQQTLNVDSNLVIGVPIRSADSGFCNITAENGYISANITPMDNNPGAVPIGDFLHLNALWGGGSF